MNRDAVREMFLVNTPKGAQEIAQASSPEAFDRIGMDFAKSLESGT
jgi:hypothetical protein